MSPNRGWVLILFGLLISSFFGGAIHVLLSPARVTEFVNGLVQQYEPKFTINFQAARLRLAEGWVPIVAIELDGLTIKAKDPCITGSKITGDRLIVPLQLFPLISKKVRFGQITARDLQLQWLPAECKEPGHQARIIQSADIADNIGLLERFFHDRWKIEIVNTSHLLRGFQVQKFDLLTAKKISILRARDFRADLEANRHRVVIHSDVLLGKPWIGGVPVGEFRMGAEINATNVHVGARGNLKEGQIAVDSRWNVETGNLKISSNFTDLPIQGALDLAKHWGALTAFHPHLHDEWLSCGLSYEGDIRAISRSDLKTSSCRMYGDLGDWQLMTPEISIQNPFPIEWRLTKINVQRWLAGFGVNSTWGVIGRFGNFTGDLSLVDPNKLHIKGRLRDFSAYVADANNRAKLRLDSVKLNTTVSNDQLSGKLEQAQIENGQIGGSALFDFSTHGTGQLQLSLQHVQLPLTVQKVFWNGQIPDLAVSGPVGFKNFQFDTFNGRLSISKLQTVDCTAHKIDATVKFKKLQWNVRATANEMSIRSSGRWQPLAAKMSQKTTHPLSLRRLSGELAINNSGGGTWSKFKSFLAKPRAIVISSGAWDSQKTLTGHVEVLSHLHRRLKRQLITIGGNVQKPLFSD